MANSLRLERALPFVQVVPRLDVASEAPQGQILPYRSGPERSAERLFAALEASHALVGDRRLSLKVYSVTDDATCRWVQLGLVGAYDQYLVTFAIRPESGVADVALALSSWFSDPAHAQDLLDMA
jgi:hypothetical protein